MTNTQSQPDNELRGRLRELNTKAYYLLVALSFIYAKGPVTVALKIALTMTAAVAVLPVQDYVQSTSFLECFRFFKVILLTAALVFTLYWIWAATFPVLAK